MESMMWNTRRTCRIRTQSALSLSIAAITIFSSFVTASNDNPVLTQTIGFAGTLKSQDSGHTTNERSPLFQSGSSDEQYFNSNQNYKYHPNHRYPDEHLNYNSNGKDRYIFTLKKQPTSSISQAYSSPGRRLELHDEHYQERQYGSRPKPSPTPIYRKVYHHESPAIPENSYYTKRPTFEDISTPQPEPKKYAFAYAVRDGHNGDDYSHKESRDGKVTMGEYKVLLPDGRLQVVRYTADAKQGFKADVTYEGDDKYDASHLAKPTEKPYTYPKSPYYHDGNPVQELRKQYLDVSVTPSPLPTYVPSYHSKSPTPIYSIKSYPSISPSIVYKGNEHPGYYQNNPNSISPTPYGFVKNNASPSPSSIPPKNIYDKINTPSPSKSPYSPIPYGYRAGPGPSPSSPTKPSFYKIPYDEVNSSPPSGARRHRKISEAAPTPNYINTSTLSGKSRLIPIEHFKAGPYTHSPREFSKFLVSPTPTPSYQQQNRHEGVHQDHHYIVVQDHRQNDDNHRQDLKHQDNLHITEDYLTRNYRSQEEDSKINIPPVKSSLATFTSFLGGTPKPLYYVKSKPAIGVGRPIKPSVGGLVYLETPGHGIRPTAYGVKEILDRIPHDNLPRPKTTTHPYELGSKDYGDAVSYGHSGDRSRNNKVFIPSQQIPNEFLIPELNTDNFSHHHADHDQHQHHSREFLRNSKHDDVLVSYENH